MAQIRTGKDAILDAAVDRFERAGFHGTTMRDIAQGAGLTVASIYNHFPSKQLMLQDIMARVLSDALALTRDAVLRAERHPEAQLSALVHAWLVFHTKRRAEALIGASEIRSLDPAGRRLIVALRDEQEAMFRSIIERGVEEGTFATPHPEQAVRALIAMGTAVASWYNPDGALTPEQMGQRYVRLALGTVEAVSIADSAERTHRDPSGRSPSTSDTA